MATARIIVIAAWILAASYIGAAGFVACKALENTSVSSADQSVDYRGINFQNEQQLQEFLHDSERANLFPWIFTLPQEFAPLIASLAFGLLGGSVALLRLSLNRDGPSFATVVALPVFSAFVGLMVYLMSVVLPTIFTAGENPARPETLLGISLFGGVFSEQTFQWVRGQVFEKLFKSSRDSESQKSLTN